MPRSTPAETPGHTAPARLDRLIWVGEIGFESYGVRVGVRANQASLLERVPGLLPFGARPCAATRLDRVYSLVANSPAPDALVQVYGDDAALSYPEVRRRAFDVLCTCLDLCIAELAESHVFVHAGVVGWHGRAMVLPGPTNAGKTTLVTALVQAGATYYSDEYALVDTDGLVHPFARPPRLRGSQSSGADRRALERLHEAAGVTPLPLGLVVVSTYQPEANWQPRELSRAEGMLALLANTPGALHRPEPVLTTLQRATAGARILQGTRGEPAPVVADLLSPAGEVE